MCNLVGRMSLKFGQHFKNRRPESRFRNIGSCFPYGGIIDVFLYQYLVKVGVGVARNSPSHSKNESFIDSLKVSKSKAPIFFRETNIFPRPKTKAFPCEVITSPRSPKSSDDGGDLRDLLFREK